MEVDLSEFIETDLDIYRRTMLAREKSFFFAKFHPSAIFPIFSKKCKDCDCVRCSGPKDIQVLPLNCVMRKAIEKRMKRKSIRFVQIEVRNEQQVGYLQETKRSMKTYFGFNYVQNPNFDVIWVDDHMVSPKSYIIYGGWVKNMSVWSFVPQKLHQILP